jgi:histidinol-phosphatase
VHRHEIHQGLRHAHGPPACFRFRFALDHPATQSSSALLGDCQSPCQEVEAAHSQASALGPTQAEHRSQVGSSLRTWVLDPIDGTNFFAEGSPDWRVQIALEDDGEVVVALVDMPALGTRWWATRGGGTFERGPGGSVRRLAVSTTSLLSGAVLTCYPDTVGERLPVEAELRSWRRLSLPEVIRGGIEAFYVDCCQVWDHAPWVLLVEEAGGRFTDHEGGRSPAKRGGLYSNAAVHDELLDAINAQRRSG